MKTVCFYLLCLMCAYSCKHSNVLAGSNVSTNNIKLHEGEWYFNFKNEVFMRCLKKLYPSEFTTIVDSTDASSAANLEWLGYRSDVLSVVDSLSNEFVRRKETTWTIENKKVTMNICLSYRNSAELDSAAVSIFKKVHSKHD